MINSGGRGRVNYQTQIVTTKLPNGKYPNLPTTSDRFSGGVNYQVQIVTTKLPNENIQT